MLNKNTKFIIAIVLQVLIILVIIIFKISVLTGGTSILLKIAPVDPRDPLRGDYVTFAYDISTISAYSHDLNLNNPSSPSIRLEPKNSDDKFIKNGQTIYVVLRKGSKYWYVQKSQSQKPTNDEIFIKGVVQNVSGGINSFDKTISVKYGIEEYFIPEGKGINFNFWDRDASARVVVDKDGNAVLRQIYIDDKPWP
ncbi:MAG TPA: GDYXXLXY domain-containing protein [Candidatus Paceibacterota bacterium]|nr:GDYXXLXY domain-containing protein [Candidatus Paceibacterota bacterium]HMP18966.1 GDYXXLXY domain-containing protein [Candidatus Paceibacterota bacterium]HMP85479.1 GDYXXLXY domain-containing protein [Candidatus Paceibacterota bacterium]